MKAFTLSAAALAGLLSPAHAQDTAPATLAGKTGVVVISTGAGNFAAVGGYRIAFSALNATYSVTPLSSTVSPASGTYTYVKTGANTARITTIDNPLAAPVAQTFVFTSTSTATYAVANPLGSQTGTFVLENAPPNPAGRSGVSNFSVRAVVPSVGQIIPALVVDAPARVLIRVAGPALTAFGVTGVLANPRLTLMSGNTPVATNDDWASTISNHDAVVDAAAKTGAFAFSFGSRDAALVVDLPAGSYTCFIRGDSGTSGEVLLEVYQVPL